MIEIGVSFEKEIVVTEEMLANVVDKDLPPVYSTPSMIALMELTSGELMKKFLTEEQGSVGMTVNVKHISATPCGKAVKCESKVLNVDGKKVEFEVNAYDDKGLIGTGTHKRARKKIDFPVLFGKQLI